MTDENRKVLDMFDLTGKVAVVTGGARGLGRQHAFALAEAGADVAICDLLEDEGAKTRSELEAMGRRAYSGKVDVSKPDQIDEFVQNVEEALGPIDILVNNAARPSEGVALHEVEDDVWREIIDINLSSMFYVGKRVAKRMIEHTRGGSIINISSINAFVISNIAPRHNVTYCVAKAAIAQLTKGMAAEWAPYNIRANAIAPGYILTDQTAATASIREAYERNVGMTPMKRYGNLDELKGAIVYLASDASTYTTGSVMLVDGGYTVW
ncbi:MAG: SDR family oxidoreductase [Armatimonadetes bacterium]|nr:SDR family oxidoreductase [Armatimonadota bacterium]